jgi:hypothetical protein
MPADPSLRPRSVSSETQIDLFVRGEPRPPPLLPEAVGAGRSAAISSQSNRAQRGTSENSRRGAVRPAWWVEVDAHWRLQHPGRSGHFRAVSRDVGGVADPGTDRFALGSAGFPDPGGPGRILVSMFAGHVQTGVLGATSDATSLAC